MIIDMDHPDAFKYTVVDDKGNTIHHVVSIDINLKEYTVVETYASVGLGRKVKLVRAKSITRDPWKFKIVITPLDDSDVP